MHESGSRCFMVRPNRSLPVTGIVALFASLSVMALTIGVGFSLAGAWMVLPFAGLEIAVIAALCRWLYRHLDDYERVLIGPERVQIVQRWGTKESHQDFPRYWVRVTLDRRQDERRPSRLSIGSHGKFVSLAEHINEGERLLLAQELRNALRHS
jgi:uncharacterized membrane protein